MITVTVILSGRKNTFSACWTGCIHTEPFVNTLKNRNKKKIVNSMKIMNSYLNVDDLILDIEVIDMYVKKYRPIRRGKKVNRKGRRTSPVYGINDHKTIILLPLL